MSNTSWRAGDSVVIDRPQLQHLFQALTRKGYQVLGPTVRAGDMVLAQLSSIDELPVGCTDEQDGGSYRLKKRPDQALFGYTVAQHSWKRFLHLPQQRLWRATRENHRFQIIEEKPNTPRFAFFGVRPCDLQAIAILDKVFLEGEHSDTAYQARRDHVFIVAVNCTQAGGTCFCVSMNTGPKARSGFDLALTEVLEEGGHYFLVEVGTERGGELLKNMKCRKAGKGEQAAADVILTQTAQQMGRTLDTTEIKELLYRNYEHPRWDEVANRCLTCANCTMVCPTCFCNKVEDFRDLTGEQVERRRRWDSCFTLDFTYLHGGSVRTSPRSRYRQWLTHKLATWIDQFGTSGCVGCGRCITWCPVGIDITEEVRAIRESEPVTAVPSKLRR